MENIKILQSHSSKVSVSFFFNMNISFSSCYSRMFHLWPKKTGLFNVRAFSGGNCYYLEEDGDLLSDGDSDGGDGDDYDSVDLLPEYFLDHVLDVFGIKWNDALGVWKK